MDNSKSIIRKSLVDQVFELLLNRIQTGELRPGERLNIEDLSKEFGVSRTPVREAIGKLQETGLVVITHNIGPSVAIVNSDTAKGIIEANAIMVKAISDLVFQENDCEKIADELEPLVTEGYIAFHEKFVQACPNNLLRDVTLGMLIKLDSLVLSNLEWDALKEELIREQSLLVKHLREGKSEDFKKLMLAHNMKLLNYWK